MDKIEKLTADRAVRVRLKTLLEARGMTQTDLVELTGLRHATISNLARERYDRVQLEHLAIIATALDVTDINDLLTIEKR
ncbi:DNA-binding Xre family transcriptional regulator [Alkalibacillus flavidus]|uniref:DNA-binding Xre family transcriptional regulator n=1 Tax=Alkalibacillus flavidus TaxID=546021 RepID=A0ABV2KVP2_9BACI